MKTAILGIYVLFVVASGLISVFVSYRLLLEPTQIKSHPKKYFVPLSVSLVLALVSGVLYFLYSALPRIDYSCNISGYAVPATVTCDARNNSSELRWSIWKDQNLISGFSNSRISWEIKTPGQYDVTVSGDTTLFLFPLHTFNSFEFEFGAPTDIVGTETRTFEFRYEKKVFTQSTCELHRFPMADNETAKFVYLRQINGLDGYAIVFLDKNSKAAILKVCFSIGPRSLGFASKLDNGSVTGLLVVGLERK